MASSLRPAFIIARQPPTRPTLAASFAFRHPIRNVSANAAKYKRRDNVKAKAEKKKKKSGHTSFRQPDLNRAEQFSLCDAMRYIRAFEVGQPVKSVKYDLAIRIRTPKNGPVLRDRLRLPHPVMKSVRICVICPPDTAHAKAATAAGAVLVGEENVFEEIRKGNLNFQKCICHTASLTKLQKSGLGKILGPKGLMPNAKNQTVVSNVAKAMGSMSGGNEYRERTGVVRMVIGQLQFTPEEMRKNISFLLSNLKRQCMLLREDITKEVHEVVLSSTHSPGFSLNGEFRSPNSVPVAALST